MFAPRLDLAGMVGRELTLQEVLSRTPGEENPVESERPLPVPALDGDEAGQPSHFDPSGAIDERSGDGLGELVRDRSDEWRSSRRYATTANSFLLKIAGNVRRKARVTLPEPPPRRPVPRQAVRLADSLDSCLRDV